MTCNRCIWLVERLFYAQVCKSIFTKDRTSIHVGSHEATLTREGLYEITLIKYQITKYRVGQKSDQLYNSIKNWSDFWPTCTYFVSRKNHSSAFNFTRGNFLLPFLESSTSYLYCLSNDEGTHEDLSNLYWQKPISENKSIKLPHMINCSSLSYYTLQFTQFHILLPSASLTSYIVLYILNKNILQIIKNN